MCVRTANITDLNYLNTSYAVKLNKASTNLHKHSISVFKFQWMSYVIEVTQTHFQIGTSVTSRNRKLTNNQSQPMHAKMIF